MPKRPWALNKAGTYRLKTKLIKLSQMFEDAVREAIRQPTAEGANAIMQGSIPQEVQGFIPDLINQLDAGVPSDIVADQALNKTFDIVESAVLVDGVNHVLDNFSGRIMDLLFGQAFLNVLSQAAQLITNT
jgi:hypothetical protein